MIELECYGVGKYVVGRDKTEKKKCANFPKKGNILIPKGEYIQVKPNLN